MTQIVLNVEDKSLLPGVIISSRVNTYGTILYDGQ